MSTLLTALGFIFLAAPRIHRHLHGTQKQATVDTEKRKGHAECVPACPVAEILMGDGRSVRRMEEESHDIVEKDVPILSWTPDAASAS